jgi:hypothetical protein
MEAVRANPTDSIFQLNLVEYTKERDAQLAVAKLYRQAQTEITEKISRLSPSEFEIQMRAAKQRQIAEGIEARGRTQQEIRRLTEQLSRFLSVYDEQTDEMAKVAETISLTISRNDFDACLQKLRASLPAEQVFEASAHQDARFVGRVDGRKPYRVRVEHLILAETLSHNGIYHFGEAVLLDEKEAADLMATDFSAATHQAPWRAEPPMVMTPEDHEVAVRTAEAKGISPESICFWSDAVRDQADKEWYRRNLTSRAQRRRTVAPENKLTLRSGAKIQAKVTGNLSLAPGTLCRIGEIVELPTMSAAWSCAETGAIGPP